MCLRVGSGAWLGPSRVSPPIRYAGFGLVSLGLQDPDAGSLKIGLSRVLTFPPQGAAD